MSYVSTATVGLPSLHSGRWFKLICGASYQSLPTVRNLALAYTLAGADCIDMAADAAVVSAVKAGIQAAVDYRFSSGLPPQDMPLVMVSMSAGEDPHFRKAWFDPQRCPTDCPRPCMQICPADAIPPGRGFTDAHVASLTPIAASASAGVIDARCYGCGRCWPVCPLGLIESRSQPTSYADVAPELLPQVDGLEIHTQVGRLDDFVRLWEVVKESVRSLQVVSISCPDSDEADFVDYLQTLWTQMRPVLSAPDTPVLIWQTDGRPMSGDIGKGTTHAAIRLAQKVLAADLPGHVQLAGGTNLYTVLKLDALGLWQRQPGTVAHRPPMSVTEVAQKKVSGVAYGSFARRLLQPVIEPISQLESAPAALQEAVTLAASLVAPLKSGDIRTIDKGSAKSTRRHPV